MVPAQDLADLLQCLILRKQQPEAALQQLDELAGRHIEGLRALTKSIQDVRLRRDNDGIRAAIQQYDDALERYIPGGHLNGRKQYIPAPPCTLLGLALVGQAQQLVIVGKFEVAWVGVAGSMPSQTASGVQQTL